MRNFIQSSWHAFTQLFRHRPVGFVYAALGDSTVEGTGASHRNRSYAHLVYVDLARYYEQAEYHNFGKHGARVRDVLEKQLEPACNVDPNLITISIGANDVLHGTSLRQFRVRIGQILSTLQDKTDALIIVTTIPDFSFTKRIPRAAKPVTRLRIRQYNHLIRQAAAAAGATVIDTFRESSTIARRFPEAISGDNFHPSDLGYSFWANTMLGVIHDKLRSRSHRWLFG